MNAVLWLACLWFPVGLLAQQPASGPPQEADAEVVTAPVELDGTTLFRVRGVSSYPAADRANRIHEQLVVAAADGKTPIDAFHLVDTPQSTRIQAGPHPIMNVLDADATMEQVSRQALALAHLTRIQRAVEDYRADRAPAAIRRGLTNALIATLLLVLSVLVLAWSWRWLDRTLTARLRARIHTVHIRAFELIRAERIRDALRGTLIAVRAAAVLALLLIWLGYVLGEFPWTRGLSANLLAFALEPVRRIAWGLVSHVPSLVFLAVLFVALRLLLRVIRLFFSAVEHGSVKLAGFEPVWAQPTYKIVRAVVVAFGIIIAFPYIPGSNSAAFQGISLFVGLLFSLGSSSVIANIIAGYAMIYRRAFKVGDRIKIGDSIGEVIETRLQVTHLRSLKNEEIIIPNSHILSNEVLNYSSLSREQGLLLHTEVGIGYETSWQQVEAMLIEAARRTPGLGTDASPFVLEKKLDTFCVVYELNVRCTNVAAMAPLYAALHRHILDVFNERGVQIMTPAYESDPPEPKLVPPQMTKPPVAAERFDTH